MKKFISEIILFILFLILSYYLTTCYLTRSKTLYKPSTINITNYYKYSHISGVGITADKVNKCVGKMMKSVDKNCNYYHQLSKYSNLTQLGDFIPPCVDQFHVVESRLFRTDKGNYLIIAKCKDSSILVTTVCVNKKNEIESVSDYQYQDPYNFKAFKDWRKGKCIKLLVQY